MGEKTKSLLLFLFYGLIVGLLAWIGYQFVAASISVSKDLGAFFGAVLGVVLCVILWIYLGKKLVG